MSTLHDQLAELADDAPAAGPLPGDLWQRGRRIARVRRAGTVVVVLAACAALVVVAGLGWASGRSVSVGPAESRSSPAMPDRLEEPSGWLGEFDGPPGALAAVYPTARKHLVGSEPGIVGVSATTGKYAFLDLPDVAGIYNTVALSPDGRRVAYWITGKTTGKAIEPRTDGGPITGYAVYDAFTGRTQRMPVSTEHGLEEFDLAWVGDDSLLVQFGQRATSSEGMSSEPLLWRSAGRTTGLSFGVSSAALLGHGWMATRKGRRNLESGAVQSLTGPYFSMSMGYVVSPDATVAATTLGEDLVAFDRTGKVLVDDPDARTMKAYYWLDDTRVLAVRAPDPVSDDRDLELFDLKTKQWTRVVIGVQGVASSGGNVLAQQVAFDLLADPTVPADGPPHPLGARWTLGLTVTIVVLGGLVLTVWRRRVRP